MKIQEVGKPEPCPYGAHCHGEEGLGVLWQTAWQERAVPSRPGTEPSTHRRWAWGMGGGGLDLFSISASVEHLLQIRVQEHPCGVQLFSDGTELWKGRIHFLKVFSGTIVGLWKQPDATSFVPWSWHFRGVSKRHPCVCVLACVTPLPPGTYVHMHTCTHTHRCAHNVVLGK